MKSLPHDWLTSGLQDAEYKKYLLLSYLQHVSGNFERIQLYPVLGEVVEHHRNLLEIRKKWEDQREEFKKELIAIDMENGHLIFRSQQDEDLMVMLREIMEYAIPKFDQKLLEGRDIYDLVEKHIVIDILGIEPLYKKEGYLLLTLDGDPSIRVYRYRFQLFSSDHEKWVGMETRYLFSDLRNHSSSMWKSRLTRTFPDLPNPLIFRIHSEMKFPVNETLLPISKRLLIPRIAA